MKRITDENNQEILYYTDIVKCFSKLYWMYLELWAGVPVFKPTGEFWGYFYHKKIWEHIDKQNLDR